MRTFTKNRYFSEHFLKDDAPKIEMCRKGSEIWWNVHFRGIKSEKLILGVFYNKNEENDLMRENEPHIISRGAYRIRYQQEKWRCHRFRNRNTLKIEN